MDELMPENEAARAGRALDARVAREVLGLTVEDRRLWQAPDDGRWAPCPWCSPAAGGPAAYCPAADLGVPADRHPVGPCYLDAATGEWGVVPFYSTRIEAAWEVVGRLADRGHVILVKADGLRTGSNPRYTAMSGRGRADGEPGHHHASAHTAAEAICRLAARIIRDSG